MDSLQIAIIDSLGNQKRNIDVPSAVFATNVNVGLLHQVTRWQRAKKRAGTHACATRAQVSGGGVKPWKQKGTGRARSGSNTSPLWVGGGVAHGPKPRDYEFRVNKKERKLALCCAITVKFASGQIKVIEDLVLSKISTKEIVNILNVIGVNYKKKTLVIVSDDVNNHQQFLILEKSLRNLEKVKILNVKGLNVYDILDCDNMLVIGSNTIDMIIGKALCASKNNKIEKSKIEEA